MSENTFPTGRVWDMFKLILSIPHPSGSEHKLSERLAQEARSRGLEAKFDSYGNLRIDRKASPGFEDKPAVLMQGHLDMICEKLPELDFDFQTEGIKTEVSDGYLHACGTTLGADNGIGSAMALALLFDENHVGGALAGVFTLEEEVGLVGAANLSSDMLCGKYLLNLDSDEEGIFAIGCAGGARLTMDIPVPFVPAACGYCAEISVSGLPGGHSGVEINKRHGNALVFLAQLLAESKVEVSDILCQNADNVIPGAAVARVISSEPPESLANIFCSKVEKYKEQLADGVELEVTVSEISELDSMWESAWRKKMISAMANVPNGVLEFADEFGVPRTSSNFAAAKVNDGVLNLHFSQRSLDNAKRKEATELVIKAFDKLDKTVSVSKEYSGWNPAPESRINKTASEVWEKLYGEKPVFHVIHAGLEAGILSKINPELELISFGPTAYDIHSTKERVSIDSVERVYGFMTEFIKKLQQ